MADKKLNLRRIMELYAIYARLDLAWFLKDTKICLMAISADFISNIAAVTGIFLLAYRFDGVGGMDKYEVLFMLGYVTALTGIIQAFFNFNVGHISRRIGRGQLEHMLIQPLPLAVQLLTEGFIPFSGTSNLFAGLIVMTLAVKSLAYTVTLVWLMHLAIQLLVSAIIVLALNYLFSSLAFYAPSQAEEISTYVRNSAHNLSTYPLSGMSLAVQLPLLSVFPAGLLGWFPSLALLGETPLGLPALYPIIVASVLVLITARVFSKGYRHYLTSGSPRYSSVGHRR
ncbi:MAG TPA: ABC-2 family transporter protein [Bacillota bacterium]|nr:ABC-2 family transporter protein [Bacillota bacterium]